MGCLSGKIAVVTGAGREQNIGEAICSAFLEAGASAVIATDITMPDGKALEARLSVAGPGQLILVEHDVTDPQSWAHLVHKVQSDFGQIDVLVNNAGIAIHGGILETSIEDLRKVMAVNHDSILMGIQSFAPMLSECRSRFAGGASVINTLSIGSYMANAHNIGYHASKAAARMTTMCAAAELGALGIRVNSVHPGVTLTPLIAAGLDDYVGRGVWADRASAESGLAGMNALGTLAMPQDIAPLYVFLASEAARHITGAAYTHDSGFNLRF
ncbi:MAG: hypothetical protein RL317_822 [Pseudomonadota bacterium]|jgi:3alpha(or 20beta)-hydroxysteroid dehydrogenase/cyclopentanol dehydrogenase